jgi:hypothetical protein
LLTRRCRSSRGRTRTAFAVAFLVTEAARLRHGQDKAVSSPGLQLGRAGKVCQCGTHPRRHRADTCARASHQVSARFRPHPWPDSPVCARSIRCRTPLHRLRGMLSLISSVAKLTRPASTHRVRPKPSDKSLVAALLARLEPSLRFRFSLIALGRGDKTKWPRDFVRPVTSNTARGVAYRRRRQKLPAMLRTGKPPALSVRPASFQSLRNSPVLLAPALQKLVGLTDENQICPRPRRWTSRPAGLGCPVTISRPSFRSVPAAGTRRNWLRAGATRPGLFGRPGKDGQCGTHPSGFAAPLSCRMLPGQSHNTFCV